MHGCQTMPTRKRVRTPSQPPLEREETAPEQALEENIAAIKTWERASVHERSRVERLSDDITRIAAGGPVLVLHIIWFGAWILINLNVIPVIRPFDPFPFQLLTMIVSLEAIFLSLFVLASQNRLTHEADKRANLDLQIDLLAEREMTAVLRLLQDIAHHLHVPLSITSTQIRDLARKTDLRSLTERMEELSEAPSSSRGDAPTRVAPHPKTTPTPGGKPSGR